MLHTVGILPEGQLFFESRHCLEGKMCYTFNGGELGVMKAEG